MALGGRAWSRVRAEGEGGRGKGGVGEKGSDGDGERRAGPARPE